MALAASVTVTRARSFLLPARALAVGCMIGLMIVLGGATWEGFVAAQQAREWSQHTFEVIAAIKDLDIAIDETETGVRGYLLTGRNDYLSPYQASAGRVGTARAELLRLTVDNPIQQARLLALAPILRHRMDLLALTVRQRRDLGFASGLAILNTDVDRDLIQQIDSILRVMGGEERNLLITRLAVSRKRGTLVAALLWGSMILTVISLFGAARLLDRAAATDLLTGLYSRNRMLRLQNLHDRKRKPKMAAMLCVDLDRFRAVNQVFGAATGDKLLIEAGRRLVAVAGRHAVGRLGGDVFAIYCIGVTSADAEKLGTDAIAALAQPFALQQRNFQLTASVGVAHTQAVGGVNLRQNADDAMDHAKLLGGNRVVIFMQSMHDGRKEMAELEADLRLALAREGEIFVVYQPVVRLADRTLSAIEVLARWTHPRLGAIPTEQFINLAETTGLIIPLGLKIMDMAIRQTALWHAAYPGRCPLININVSPRQFEVGDVIADFSNLIEQHDLPAGGFCIEVTETAFVSADAVRALESAQQFGFKVAMDDFGVGYSSLSQLRRLPFTTIKLDRKLILQSAGAGGPAILAALVQFAHALELDVIAEGVEGPQELDLVTVCGCDSVQGYIFSRPLPAPALEVWFSGDVLALHRAK